MKNRFQKIITLAFIIIVIFAFSTHLTNAQAGAVATGLFGIDNIWNFFGFVASYIVNAVLWLASWFITVTGLLLDVSITLTLHIKDFVDSTPAVYDIWKTIRDISGLFIIFVLLYAAIKLILGLKSDAFGTLIKNIVIAGVVINFSFFITSIAIDASNVVSLAIYNSIVPENAEQYSSNNMNTNKILEQSAYGNARNISKIFMNALQIQRNYGPERLNLKNDSVVSPVKVIITGVTGIVIMFTVGMSFVFAALAFIIRLVILIGLLAFSPIWFAAKVVPMIGDYANDWIKTLKNQLIFMPVYLLLMYAAISILNKTTVFNYGSLGNLSSNSQGLVPTEYIAFAINAAFIIIMLNAPLLAALKLGAGNGLLNKFGANIGAMNIWKKVGGYTGVNTAGRLATSLDKKIGSSTIGNSAPMRALRSVTTGAVAKSKFGGSSSLEDYKKEDKDIADKKKEIIRKNNFSVALANNKNGIPPVIGNTIKDSINAMKDKEKLGLGAKNLKELEVAKHLKDSDYEAIKKSDDFTDEEKKQISDARYAALSNAVANGETDVIKHMVENMNGKELMKLGVKITDPRIIAHLKTSQLNTMEDEGIDPSYKQAIGKIINGLGVAGHKSWGFINKNSASWT